MWQRESTVLVTAGPFPYGSTDGPNKRGKILQLDCRGLELLEFKPEVRAFFLANHNDAVPSQRFLMGFK